MSRMSCYIYINKFNLDNIARGQKKAAETQFGRDTLNAALNCVYQLDLANMDIGVHDHGKPYFINRGDIHFNISHSGGYAAAAVCDYPVGVDIQIIKGVSDRVIEKICSDKERQFVESFPDRDRAFMRLWSLKESYIKAIGLGMTYSMKNVNFSLNGCDVQTGRFSNKEGFYTLRDYGKYILAACVLI